ncbi:MAG: type II CRISPR-associated endonuclease Cas1 [Acidobacteriota bacterium]|nr:MAG: type II CRISPR-associated endonuclease Cas1 [Acidobacteriota bacterium]
MIKRTVEISTTGCFVHSRNRQLVIEKDGAKIGSVPVEDLGVLIFDSQDLTVSSGVMRLLAEQNVAVVFTDDKHLPSSVTVPFSGHTIQTKVLSSQVGISQPAKKRLWSAIIAAKIQNQSKVLDSLLKGGTRLSEMSKRVRSGDPDNLEAQAARIYWQKLFGPEFRRERFGDGENKLLNYGYAVIRASVARALVGTGLHPGLGIKHSNQYNTFPLADDVIEPLRPFVDLRVHCISSEQRPYDDGSERILDLGRPTKQDLLKLLGEDCSFGGRRLPMLTAISYYAASIKQVITGEAERPTIPTL